MKFNMKTVKSAKTLYKTNRIYALFLIVFGIVFIAVPERVSATLLYLIVIMLTIRAATLFSRGLKAERKIERFSRYSNAVIAIALCVILVAFSDRQKNMIAVVMVIHTVAEIAECVYDCIKNRREKKKIIINAIKVLIHSVLLTELMLELGESVQTHVVIYGTMFLIQGIVGIFSSLRGTEDGYTLGRIVAKSHALEILTGLFLVVVGASILLPACEPAIKSFGDGLWYCFMLTTTIGLGDLAAITPAGRLISIVVGIYGIVVFSLITSIFINLYNEATAHGRKDEPERSIDQ